MVTYLIELVHLNRFTKDAVQEIVLRPASVFWAEFNVLATQIPQMLDGGNCLVHNLQTRRTP